MATEAPKRKANFDDNEDTTVKRRRSGVDDLVRTNGHQGRDESRQEGGRAGRPAYRDPFGGNDKSESNGVDKHDTPRSRQRSPPVRDKRRVARDNSPVGRRRDGQNGGQNGTRQRTPVQESYVTPLSCLKEHGLCLLFRRGHNERSGRRHSPSKKSGNNTSEDAPKSKAAAKKKGKEIAVDDDVEEDEEAALMMKVMGFSSFKTTKNTKVPGNDKNYGVRKEQKTEYRQYMNRTGGFNRPLSPG
ncbi:hypothetical protein FH972_023509 [Carpinus fangiana]|uniref:U4/U6.U5 small nuclear ribonucleoprotein 27kDa protein domain-containing protein n=1 Tax=Carpinus fangiana TaxID=176857 RepID=A0A5N6KVS0_9ROSI|nr:hypothetical protein FH972_023509 [Carpinus fangiana]